MSVVDALLWCGGIVLSTLIVVFLNKALSRIAPKHFRSLDAPPVFDVLRRIYKEAQEETNRAFAKTSSRLQIEKILRDSDRFTRYIVHQSAYASQRKKLHAFLSKWAESENVDPWLDRFFRHVYEGMANEPLTQAFAQKWMEEPAFRELLNTFNSSPEVGGALALAPLKRPRMRYERVALICVLGLGAAGLFLRIGWTLVDSKETAESKQPSNEQSKSQDVGTVSKAGTESKNTPLTSEQSTIVGEHLKGPTINKAPLPDASEFTTIAELILPADVKATIKPGNNAFLLSIETGESDYDVGLADLALRWLETNDAESNQRRIFIGHRKGTEPMVFGCGINGGGIEFSAPNYGSNSRFYFDPQEDGIIPITVRVAEE